MISFRNMFEKSPAFALSLAYLVLMIIGAGTSYYYYTAFHINPFQWASISDFLLAPFNKETILLALFLGFWIFLSTFSFNKGKEKKTAASNKTVNTKVLVTILCMTAAIGLFFIGPQSQINKVKHYKPGEKSTGIIIDYFDLNGEPSLDSLLFIGKLGDFTFLYHPPTETVLARPTTDIKEIHF